MKYMVWVLLASLITTTEAQAGFWDWLPGKKVRCEYSDRELRSVLPDERKNATYHTPKSHAVEAFDITRSLESKPWLRDFRYVIVINKAASGTTAQTVRVYEDGYEIASDKVSTGREKLELKRREARCTKQPQNSYFSVTATGYYPVQELIIDHRSGAFDTQMPYAIFYDRQFGLALHQVPGNAVSRLGSRASGGCTRMNERTVSDLFDRVSRTKGAEIPVISQNGVPVLDANGQVQRSRTNAFFGGRFPAYSAIVIVQDIQD